MSIYLKIYKGSVPNAKKSLDQMILISTLLRQLPQNCDVKVSKTLSKYTKLYFWDFRKRASELLIKGDKVIIQTDLAIYGCDVEVILKDLEGKIGDTIGWNRQWYGKPWSNPVGFLNVKSRHLDQKIEDLLRRSIVKEIDPQNNFFMLNKGFEFDKLFPNNLTRIRRQNH